jgi:hypothetical protein
VSNFVELGFLLMGRRRSVTAELHSDLLEIGKFYKGFSSDPVHEVVVGGLGFVRAAVPDASYAPIRDRLGQEVVLGVKGLVEKTPIVS